MGARNQGRGVKGDEAAGANPILFFNAGAFNERDILSSVDCCDDGVSITNSQGWTCKDELAMLTLQG